MDNKASCFIFSFTFKKPKIYVRNINLPRKVKFQERYKKPEFKMDKGCRIGRNYEAFQTFLEKNPDTAVVQIDTVLGSKGGKCLFTIHYVDTSLMLAFLREANTSKSLTDIFAKLYDTLGKDLFKRLFRIILTDNGILLEKILVKNY